MEEGTYSIKGIHCATCVLNIEGVLKDIKGIETFSVNFATEQLTLKSSNLKEVVDEINKKLKPIGYEIVDEQQQQLKSLKEQKIKLLYILPLSLSIFLLMLYETVSPYISFLPELMLDMMVLDGIFFLASTIILLTVGKPFLLGITSFLKGKKASMETLIGIGTFIAYVYSALVYSNQLLQLNINLDTKTFFDAIIVIIGFVYLGKYLENKSKFKTGQSLKLLAQLQAKTALLIKNEKQVEVAIEQIKVGDILIIKPGSKIPVDGEIIEGNGVIDTSMLTGEPIPQEKTIGDKVYAGTINTQGTFQMEALKVGMETSLSNIINIVKEAQNSKAPIQKTVDKVSSIFVPVVLVISVLTIVIWYIFGGLALLPLAISSFVSVLVIACPCALGLATPTAIIVGVGKAAQNGILIRNAEVLEKTKQITTVVFDKTGTLTVGKPQVEKFVTSKNNTDEILQIAYSLENNSQHPLASSIVKYCEKEKVKELKVKNFTNIDGSGIYGDIDSRRYYIGKPEYIESLSIKIDNDLVKTYEIKGKTVVLMADDKETLGYIVISDVLRQGAKQTVKKLKDMGIRTIMITGDNNQAASSISKDLKLDMYYANVAPSEKGEYIKKLQQDGHTVAMVGDGINDAPALALADISMAMSTGTEIAISTSDITLLGGDISKVPISINISKATLKTINQNLFWAFFYNIIGIPVAAGLLYPLFGILLTPAFSGLAMAFSSVSVVSNSLRLKLIHFDK